MVFEANGVRYATAYDREVLDVFTAVRHHTDLDHASRLLALNNRRHLRPRREMAVLFRDVPGAVAETIELSTRPSFQLDDLGYEFPPLPGLHCLTELRPRRDAQKRKVLLHMIPSLHLKRDGSVSPLTVTLIGLEDLRLRNKVTTGVFCLQMLETHSPATCGLQGKKRRIRGDSISRPRDIFFHAGKIKA